MELWKALLELGLNALAQPSAQASTMTAEPGDIIPAMCSCSGEEFGIVLGHADNKLSAYQGIRYPQYIRSSVVRYKNLMFPNGLIRSSDYKCPICGKRNFVQCKRCKKISCYDDSGWFSCAYCGNQGFVFGKIHNTQGMSCEVLKRENISTDMNFAQSPGNVCTSANRAVFQACVESKVAEGGELCTKH